ARARRNRPPSRDLRPERPVRLLRVDGLLGVGLGLVVARLGDPWHRFAPVPDLTGHEPLLAEQGPLLLAGGLVDQPPRVEMPGPLHPDLGSLARLDPVDALELPVADA